MISARGLFSSEAAGSSSLLKRKAQVKKTKQQYTKAEQSREVTILTEEEKLKRIALMKTPLVCPQHLN
jgi:hypothetical protein